MKKCKSMAVCKLNYILFHMQTFAMLSGTIIDRVLCIHQPLLLSLPALACIDPRWRALVRDYWVRVLDDQQRCDVLTDADHAFMDSPRRGLVGFRLALANKAALTFERHARWFRAAPQYEPSYNDL